ncbi:MAG: UDP-N-acetylmuramoyl-L-alanyl-D-glutamate--2,6-diaminopimelate ligase [Turicibacter sp.]|nr:UDP-N-acetylmuramoyl-L-alanyl-D-glutamate--2,6-diaminopimelate ligase [Turicibacter sp.]
MDIKELFEGYEGIEITGIKVDNRQVGPGDLFVCIEGYTVDGHDFAKAAEAAGAAAIVCQRPVDVTIPQIQVENTHIELPRLAHLFFDQPTTKMNLFGVTGTNGKTTTAYILEHLLTGFSESTGYIGTNGIRFADVTLEPKNTTPEPYSLQNTFNQMVGKGVRNVAMEVSSHALELHRVDYCRFQTTMFTNLTPEHLDFHPSMEHYYQAKAKLFRMMVPGGTAVINIDDEYGDRLAQELKAEGINTLTYSLDKPSAFHATDIGMTAAGTKFSLTVGEEVFEVVTPLLGSFNVYNALAALGAVYANGMSIEQGIGLLKTLPGIDGRMEIINAGQDFTVIVDYAHTPDGVQKVLEFVSDIKERNVKLVIGCPGDRDRTKRPVIAKLSVDYADEVIFTTDDPHSEDPKDILDEMTAGIDGDYEVILDRIEAIEAAIAKARKNDIILIAGRGHQKLQYWKSGNIELDDREVTRKLLKKRLGS